VVADAVVDGIVVAPATAWDVQDRARDAGCRVAVFSADAPITARDKKVACAAAWVEGDRILIEHGDTAVDGGSVRAEVPLTAQVAAALCASLLAELYSDEPVGTGVARDIAQR
jgi:hypothetical protein